MRRALPALLVVAAAASCLAYVSGASAGATKRLVALALAVVVLSVSLASGAARRGGAGSAWFAGVAFVAWSALSAVWGAEGAVLELAVLVAALGFGSVSASLGAERARRVATLAALVVGSLLAATVVAAWMTGQRGFALHAGQGNPNWGAMLLAVALPLALSEPLTASWPERTRRFVRLGCGVVIGAAIVATESRTAIIAAVAGVAVLAIGTQQRRNSWVLPLGLSGVVVGIVMLQADAERALQGRLWIHGVTLRAALDHVPFGAGLGRFHETYLAEQGRALAGLTPRDAALHFQNATSAHADLLEVALEGGPVAAALLAASLVLGIRQHLATGFAAGAAACVAFATASLADSPLHETPAPILLALTLAALPTAERAVAPSRARFAPISHVGLLVGAGLLLPSALGAFAASRARSAALTAAPERRLELLRRAASLAPASHEIALELGSARIELGDTGGAVRELERSERLDRNPASAVALGNALLARGSAGAARDAHERAVALNPGSFRARVGLAEALRRLGRFSDAESHAAVAVALLPGDARARELLDRIREQAADATLGVTPAD